MNRAGAATRDIVVVGASAGGVEALVALMRQLPEDFDAAMFVVLHLAGGVHSVLPQILARAGRLPTRHATDGDAIENGYVSIAPPGCHLELVEGAARVHSGPAEHGHRPAIDPLFRTAATVYGERVIGVVLSGTMDDGAAGARAVSSGGGIVVVQSDALYSDMPDAARAAAAVDYDVPIDKMGSLLADLTHVPLDESPPGAREGAADAQAGDEHGFGFTCPDCGGALSPVDDHGLPRFRCRTGHVFSPDSLGERQSARVEEAVWSAYRMLEERAALLRRLAERMRERGPVTSRRFDRDAERIERQVEALRALLRID
jgi:two-component system chemotaxis response regulator CheB